MAAQTNAQKTSSHLNLETYKINKCNKFQNRVCTNKNDCQDWHYENERRRKLTFSNGQLSYSPNAFCQHFNENTGLTKDCPVGDSCPRLHSKFEKFFHPVNYKTRLCNKKDCSLGARCSFAHGQDDLRQTRSLLVSIPNGTESPRSFLNSRDSTPTQDNLTQARALVSNQDEEKTRLLVNKLRENWFSLKMAAFGQLGTESKSQIRDLIKNRSACLDIVIDFCPRDNLELSELFSSSSSRTTYVAFDQSKTNKANLKFLDQNAVFQRSEDESARILWLCFSDETDFNQPWDLLNLSNVIINKLDAQFLDCVFVCTEVNRIRSRVKSELEDKLEQTQKPKVSVVSISSSNLWSFIQNNWPTNGSRKNLGVSQKDESPLETLRDHLKLYLILKEVGEKYLKKMLLDYIQYEMSDSGESTIETFFQQNRSLIDELKNSGKFDVNQYNLMYPSDEPTKTLQFDLSLLILIFEHVAKYESNCPHEWSLMKQIRTVRNRAVHMSRGECSSNEKTLIRLSQAPPSRGLRSKEYALSNLEWSLSHLCPDNKQEIEKDIEKCLKDCVSMRSRHEMERFEAELAALARSDYGDIASRVDNVTSLVEANQKTLNSLEQGQKLDTQLVKKLANIENKMAPSPQEQIHFDDFLDALTSVANSNRLNFTVMFLINSENRTQPFDVAKLGAALTALDTRLIVDLDWRCEQPGHGLATGPLVKKSSIFRIWSYLEVDQFGTQEVEEMVLRNRCLYLMAQGSSMRHGEVRPDTNDFYYKKRIHGVFEKIFHKTDLRRVQFVNVFLSNSCNQNELKALCDMVELLVNSIKWRTKPTCYNLSTSWNTFENIDYLKMQLQQQSNIEKIAYVSESLDQMVAKMNQLNSFKQIQMRLPRNDGSDFVIDESSSGSSSDDLSAITTLITIYHKRFGENNKLKAPAVQTLMKSFLRGESITPELLFADERRIQMNTFAKRTVMTEMSDWIEKKLKSKAFLNDEKPAILCVSHEPSSGGTTVGRYLLYKFRKQTPCIEINKLDDLESIKKGLDLINRETNNPLLVLIDQIEGGSKLDAAKSLMFNLKESLIPAIIIVVQRRFKVYQPDPTWDSSDWSDYETKEFQLTTQLDDYENPQFESLFRDYLPTSVEVNSLGDIFLYGLLTFQGNFGKIDPFVENRIKGYDEKLKAVLFLASLCNLHTNQKLPLALLAAMLDLVPSSVCEFFLIDRQLTKPSKKPNHSTLGDFLQVGHKFRPARGSKEDENGYLKELRYFLKFDYVDDRQNGFVPYCMELSRSLMKHIAGEKKSDQVKCAFDELIRVSKLPAIDESDWCLEGFVRICNALFIEKTQKTKESTSGSQEHFSVAPNDDSIFVRYEDIFYSIFLNSTRRELGDPQTKTMLKKVLIEFERSRKLYSDLCPHLASVIARFVFFNGEFAEGIGLMKQLFEIKTSIRAVASFPERVDKHSDLFATYGNLMRHDLNKIQIGKIQEKLQEDISTLKETNSQKKEAEVCELKKKSLNKVIEFIQDILCAYGHALRRNQSNEVALAGEIQVHFKLLEFFYEVVCQQDKVEYTKQLANAKTPKLVRESEGLVQQKLDQFDWLIERGLCKQEGSSRTIFVIRHQIVAFRTELDISNLGTALDQVVNRAPINVFWFLATMSNGQRPRRDLEGMPIEHIKLMVEKCQNVLNGDRNLICYSNYKNLVEGFIQITQKDSQLADSLNCTLDRIYEVARDWFKYSESRPAEKTDIANFYRENSEACYFLALFSMLKAIRQLDQPTKGSDFRELLEKAKGCFFKCYTIKKNNPTWNYHYKNKYFIGEEIGLKCLKQNSDFKLRWFSGVLKPIEATLPDKEDEASAFKRGKKEKRSSYKVNINEFDHILKAYYSPHVMGQLNKISEKTLSKGCQFEFNLLCRPDKIYIINLREKK